MIEVKMERVINRYGNLGLKIRAIRCLTQKQLPPSYICSTDVRCCLVECGSIPCLRIAGVKGRIIPAPWDLGDEAIQPYPTDGVYLQVGSAHGWPCIMTTLGFMFEAGCNLQEARKPSGMPPVTATDLQIWMYELRMHLSPEKDGRFDRENWKGYVTVKI